MPARLEPHQMKVVVYRRYGSVGSHMAPDIVLCVAFG